MREAICQYTSRAAERLRYEQRCAKMITLFLRTNRFTRVRIWSSPVLQTMPDENRLLSYIRSQMKLNDRFGPR